MQLRVTLEEEEACPQPHALVELGIAGGAERLGTDGTLHRGPRDTAVALATAEIGRYRRGRGDETTYNSDSILLSFLL